MISDDPLPSTVASGRPRTPAHRLADANRELVYHVISRRFSSLLVDDDRLGDAFVAGYLGLMRAAERFDPTKGVAFSTYAYPCIVGNLLRYLALDAKQRRLEAVSLDVPVSADDDALDLVDTLADPMSERPYAVVVNSHGLGATLASALDKLTELQRGAVTAVHLRELSTQQYAAEIGAPLSAARAQVDAGMRNLRKDAALQAAVFN